MRKDAKHLTELARYVSQNLSHISANNVGAHILRYLGLNNLVITSVHPRKVRVNIKSPTNKGFWGRFAGRQSRRAQRAERELETLRKDYGLVVEESRRQEERLSRVVEYIDGGCTCNFELHLANIRIIALEQGGVTSGERVQNQPR